MFISTDGVTDLLTVFKQINEVNSQNKGSGRVYK